VIRPRLILLVPFVFYLMPFLAGYGWSSLSPLTPGFPGVPIPERKSELPTAVEWYGTGVVVVPLQARLRAYLRDGDLPLWNPYSGLGQPFAAQGEGSPYFPPAILRSLLPTSWSNLVTFGMIGISGVSLYLFLRLLGLSPGAAAFGGAAWSFTGQFTMNLARNNYVDQFAMIPPLFLAAAWAITSRRAVAYVVFALVVGLHGIAGLLQIGVNTLLLLTGFLLFFSVLRGVSMRGRLATIVTVFIFFGLGTAVAAPYILPIVEGVRAAYNKNVPYLAFLPMPVENVTAFFMPLVFGQIFESWIEGRFPDVVDWNNLYAHGSTGLLLLGVLALAALPRVRWDQRLTYLFFLGGLIFFHTRYMSVPPGSLVSYLPILSQQSPKHTNGLAVFCLVVIAAFGVEWLRRVEWRLAGTLILVTLLCLGGSLVYTAWHRGVFAAESQFAHLIDTQFAVVYLSLTAVIGLILLLAFWLAHNAPTDGSAALTATAAVVGECSIYLLLGNGELSTLAVRIGIYALVVIAGLLMAHGVRVPAAVAGLAAVCAYAWVVIAPSAGLPKRVEVDVPPPYMVWLRQAAGDEYRVFGIHPDYSSIGEIQDVEVVGPIATNEWVTFVDLIASRVVAMGHRNGSTFALSPGAGGAYSYNLTTDYPRARPLLDWAGVRYIVLDKRVFHFQSRVDQFALFDPALGLRIAFEDDDVTIVESPTAQPKAFFTTSVREVIPETTMTRLQTDPGAIDGPIAVEVDIGDVVRADGDGRRVAVPLAEYRPNDLRATFDAPGPGVFVVKDSVFPGWEATLNGRPVEIIRVNALVRGVVIPSAGRYEVTMSYRPTSFAYGVWMAAATLSLLLVLVGWESVVRWRARLRHVSGAKPARSTRSSSTTRPVPANDG